MVKENGPEIKVPQDMGPQSMRLNKTQNQNYDLTKRNVHTTVKTFKIMCSRVCSQLNGFQNFKWISVLDFQKKTIDMLHHVARCQDHMKDERSN